MPRYFLELQYKGTRYSGFQEQRNANTVQAEVENAFTTVTRLGVSMTGSSRTDAGVHARQNYFHFDMEKPVAEWDSMQDIPTLLYKMNAVLPDDIMVKGMEEVKEDAHCRFDAVAREYRYYIYREKDPFLKDRAYYFPYKLDIELMQRAAGVLKEYEDFTSFSKRNTQVKSFRCKIEVSEWYTEGNMLVFHIRANRFLRGMVRALTATMLKLGRGKLSEADFRAIIEAKDCTRASFAVPPQGLFLEKVVFPQKP
ncbi:MAG: tRNA pseudouridine(38-40) synthase TruA [Chitinophagaceae bacterium]|nr:tRNA pseudouridine(38-40) synthase TruA [Chitinophagaceae bacterium]